MYHHHRPSRLLWFFFGGLAATWWMKHHEYHHRDRALAGGGGGGFCVRKRIDPSQAPKDAPSEAVKWEEEKERLVALGRRASDTMADVSEATLDAILTAVEALKARLADHRAQRTNEKEEQTVFQP